MFTGQTQEVRGDVEPQRSEEPHNVDESEVLLPMWPAIDADEALFIVGRLGLILSGQGAMDQTSTGNDGPFPVTYLKTIFPRVVAMHQHLIGPETASEKETDIRYFWKEVQRILRTQRTLRRSTYDVLGRLEARLMDLTEETQMGGGYEFPLEQADEELGRKLEWVRGRTDTELLTLRVAAI